VIIGCSPFYQRMWEETTITFIHLTFGTDPMNDAIVCFAAFANRSYDLLTKQGGVVPCIGIRTIRFDKIPS
jgi:hypothetical protein